MLSRQHAVTSSDPGAKLVEAVLISLVDGRVAGIAVLDGMFVDSTGDDCDIAAGIPANEPRSDVRRNLVGVPRSTSDGSEGSVSSV